MKAVSGRLFPLSKAKEQQTPSKTIIYADRNLQTGSYNYRLKQMISNGNYQYYQLNGIISRHSEDIRDVTELSEPVQSFNKINYQIPKDAFVNISVYDIVGKIDYNYGKYSADCRILYSRI